MEIQADSLDGVLYNLYQAIRTHGRPHKGSRGDTLELLGVSLRILKPRARISTSENRGKPFSAIGELLWYLSGSNKLDFISRYVPAYRDDAVDGIIEGAYGPRLLAMRGSINQLDSIHRLLSEKQGSRRAVIQLFNAEDIAADHKEIPCTTTLQFHLREGLLHLSVTMRSNDAYFGLPHDVFCFTMLQEMIARRLGVELGEYYQYVGSMHVYDAYIEAIDKYVEEGFQATVEMPAMPEGDPFRRVDGLLAIEARLGAGEELDAQAETGDSYWADIVRLLQVFWAKERPETQTGTLERLRTELAHALYRPFVDGRLHLARRGVVSAGAPAQPFDGGADVAV
ncbi:thymidylate synthase [Sphingomonas quercus]|uniref:Thymidylate synthase n=1 Tax=Sphingomonas quercus TaxID=2842451 RepID=A0ABS6BHP0_9SPHN|nr:thymidylate synthase [Sphingomonas quercus]MBU3077822.1 thymidylate synthase [Sphingomonas quercus]